MDFPALIDRFQAGPSIVRRAIDGLTPAQLDALPIPGTWSIRQIVVHLLDSDLAATHRIRRIVAEDTPLLIAYDETAFAKRLRYEHTDLAVALRLLADNRDWCAQLLRRLEPAEWARTGIHNQRGKVSVEEFVNIYIHHIDHHVGFITKKRSLLGA
jgi:uncharacterized damage-inducible protein DinB